MNSETHGHLPTSQSPITPSLHFFNSVTPDGKQIPTYRVLDGTGHPLDGAEVPEVSTPHCSVALVTVRTGPFF